MGCKASRAANVQVVEEEEVLGLDEFDSILIDEYAGLQREHRRRLRNSHRRLLEPGPFEGSLSFDRLDINIMDNMDDLGMGLDRHVDRDHPSNPLFLRRGLPPRVPPRVSDRIPVMNGGHGQNGNDNAGNNDNSNGNGNGNSNGNSNGDRNHTSTSSRNEGQLDQLRSDLVTLERLFQTLLGQQVAHGPSVSPVILPSTSNSCPPAAQHIIENLPTISISKCDFEEDCHNNKECSICFLEHEVNDSVTRLPCGHFFHGECINEWLHKRCTCPICRWELETDDRLFEMGRVERMKSRRIRVKDHELDRLCIAGLQDMAGLKNVKNRAKLIKSIKNSKDIDIITKDDRVKSQPYCKECKVNSQEENEEIKKKL